MKKICGFLIFLVFLGSGLLLAEEAKEPKISFKEIRHDFGTVFQGTTARHVFEVRNTGSQTLIIDRIAPS
ncbi:MAG: DUF1573 domain-containing protein [Nitrospirota bacterium]